MKNRRRKQGKTQNILLPTVSFWKAAAGAALVLGACVFASRPAPAQTRTIYYDALTQKAAVNPPPKAVEPAAKAVKPGDTVKIVILNPNTFREEYRVKYTAVDFHTASVPASLKYFFVSSKTKDTSGFARMPVPDAALFAALDMNAPDAKAVFSAPGVGPRMKALFLRMISGYRLQEELAAHARYYALLQYIDRDLLQKVAAGKTNAVIRADIVNYLKSYFATMAAADPIKSEQDVVTRIEGSEVTGELDPSTLKKFYAFYLNQKILDEFNLATVAPPTKNYMGEEAGDFTTAQLWDLKKVGGKVGMPISNALYFVKVADREMHLAENEMTHVWDDAVTTAPVDPKLKPGDYLTFYKNHIAPLKTHGDILTTAYTAYLDNLAPRFTAAAALCDRVMDPQLTPSLIEDSEKVGVNADVFKVTVQSLPNIGNLKTLSALAETPDAPAAAAGAPPPPVEVAADTEAAKKDGSRRVPDTGFASTFEMTVSRRPVFDFSTGLIASALQDQDDDKRHSRATVALTALAHYYLTDNPKFVHLVGANALALTLGAPISQNDQVDRFLLGASLVYGQSSRVIFSVGQEAGQVSRRNKIGTGTTDTTYKKIWDNKWFAGVSFALNL